MGPRVYLRTGPPGPDLTARLLAEFLPRAREPGSTIWLAPTDRAAGEVLSRIAAGGHTLLIPGVFSLAAFAERIVPPVVSRLPRRLLLDQAISELSRTNGLSHFRRVADTRGFLDGADGLLTELDASGVTPQELARATGGPRAAKLQACANLYGAMSDRPGSESAIHRAAEKIAAGLAGPHDKVRTVFLAGFVSFTPIEWRLVAALANQADLWVALPTDVGDRSDAFAEANETRSRLQTLGSVESVDCPVQRKGQAAADRLAGLAHLEQHLFGPPVTPATDAAGLSLIEAAGPLGEARLVARRVRGLLADGVRPGAIVVTGRDLTYSFDLLGEVFAEYGLPAELDGDEPVLRNPAVGTLLRALRLPDDGWPFGGVTALLRSTYFRPDWKEGGADAARRAEGLLRLLGEPRAREAYLRAVRLWAETPPDGLEDERAEESRRLRKARLAAECRPFLERLFDAWDGLPATADPEAYVVAVRAFARDIGLESVADADPRDAAALGALWESVAAWHGPPLSRSAFLRRFTTVASSVGLPRSPRATGCVRVVPADVARHLDCDHLFIFGLGERSFPQLAPPTSLLDDADRQLLRAAGLPFPDPAARLGAEQLLFLALLARPRRGLVLSYPAVDEKGQALLPGSFLRAVRDCFLAQAVNVERQRMLIEGYLAREPYSAAEARSRFAAAGRPDEAPWVHPDLSAELCEHLRWAHQISSARFRSKDYNRYDGWLEHPAVVAAAGDRFGPAKVFSPTALEDYVACPFKFLLQHVLHLEDLDEPGEEVEHTRRGAAYHRALSRLHENLRASDPDMTRAQLPDHVGPELLAQIDEAVKEYANRAPSPASRRLWELEGRRLHRSAARYRGHWEAYVEPWRKAGAPLDPRLLEADFGLTPSPGPTGLPSDGTAALVISVGGVDVRVGGRIDRVDVAELDGELGFWIIDYKTGRSANYSAADINKFERLQLPLYALAVERVFFPGRKARPLGLAYWMVTEKGPKPVLPGARQALLWLADRKKWAVFRGQLEEWVAKVVGRIREGQFPLAPRSENCTDTCSFSQVCRISQSRHVGKVWELAPPTSREGDGAPDMP